MSKNLGIVRPSFEMILVPHLVVRDAAEAYAFYPRAFDARPEGIMTAPNGTVMHAALCFGGGSVYLAEENLEWGQRSPATLGGTPVTVHLKVDDADAVFARATEAGCAVVMPLEDTFWGDRYGILEDPFGHRWSVAQTVREVSPQELASAVASFA